MKPTACTAEYEDRRCQREEGHAGQHVNHGRGVVRRWSGDDPAEQIAENRTVEISRRVLEVLIEHSKRGRFTPGEAAAGVGARREAEKALQSS